MIYSCQKCGNPSPDPRLLQHTTSDEYRTGKCLYCKRKRVFRRVATEPAGELDAGEGRTRAERGMARAAASEGRASDWNLAADSVIRELAASGSEFTSEDVTARVGLPLRSPGAVGARMNAASKKGWIAWTGRMSQAERPNQHAAVLKVWKGIGW
jgi:DNA-directed RNA polymerase subunit RPC12/RpoP